MRRYLVLIGGILLIGFCFLNNETESVIEKSPAFLSSTENTHSDKADGNNANNQSVESNASSATQANKVSSNDVFNAGKLARLCAVVPRSNNELKEWIAKAHSDNEPFEYINDMQERFERCAERSRINVPYINLLLQAARLGSDNAVAELWTIGDTEFSKQPSSFNKAPSSFNRKSLQLFTIERYKLANSSAITGGEQSILLLIKAYQHYDPETKAQNLIKSLAFAQYAVNVLKNGQVYQKAYWFQDKLTDTLSDEDIFKAQQITDELLEKHKSYNNNL